MPVATRSVIRLYAALNVLAVAIWLLVLADKWVLPGNSVSDYGVPLGLVCLFFVLPPAAVILWRRNRGRGPVSGARRVYLLASKIFLGITWLASCIPVFFYGAIFSVVLGQAWPFSLREGPDTGFAREKFAEHFGFTPPDSVKELYCRQAWEFGDGRTYKFRFHFEDAAVVEAIVRGLRLEPIDEDVRNSWVVALSGIEWWPDRLPESYRKVYRAGPRPRLWVDSENGVACYRSWP